MPIALELYTLWVTTSFWSHKMFVVIHCFVWKIWCRKVLFQINVPRPFLWVNFSVVNKNTLSMIGTRVLLCLSGIGLLEQPACSEPAVPGRIPMAILPQVSITFLNCAFSLSHILGCLHEKYDSSISIHVWQSLALQSFSSFQQSILCTLLCRTCTSQQACES